MDAPHHDASEEDATETVPEEQWWRCAHCDTPVAHPSHAIELPGAGPVQTHVNPHGIVFLVRTFTTSQLAVSGPMVPAFSWFPGYVWRVGTCPGCRTHLGWAYIRMVGEGLGQFVGLIDTRIHLS